LTVLSASLVAAGAITVVVVRPYVLAGAVSQMLTQVVVIWIFDASEVYGTYLYG
jgi:hypothetical protein